MNRLSKQAYLGLATLGVAALATVAAVVGAGLWAHERALVAGEQALRQSVLLLDRSVDRSMDRLSVLSGELRHEIKQFQTDQALANEYLTVQVAMTEHVMLAELVDLSGQVVAASDPARIGSVRHDLPVQALVPANPNANPDSAVNIGLVEPEAGRPLITVNIYASGMIGTIYLEPVFFSEALMTATTWKNQMADLFMADGTPLVMGPSGWNETLSANGLPLAIDGSQWQAPPSSTHRTDDWLVAHRWLPNLGIHAATAVPKTIVLAGWENDLLLAGGIGVVVLIVLALLTAITLRSDRQNIRMSTELKEVTERLNLAFAGSNDGVWDWNTTEDKAYYSPRLCALLGYEPDGIEPKPQSWMNLLHEDDKQAVCQAIEDHLNGLSPVYSATHRMRRNDGDWQWVESRGKALRASDGRAYRMVGTMTDIEDKKRQENAVLAARDEAEAANRTKSDFLAVMSHEIRTPMSGVLGMAQVLLNTALTTKQRRYAELIKTSGESLLAILNDILDFSKLEAGHLDLEAMDFVLNDEIDAVVRLMDMPARAKKIELHFDDRTGGRIALNGDPTRIRQILMNLISNAIKFTEVGSVTLRCGVHARSDNRYEVKFEVIDTGIGMNEDVRRNLFMKFNQGDASIARRYGGTGLGLAICDQLTSLMNGTIKVESQPNVGSRFCVTINLPKGTTMPLAKSEPVTPAQRPDLARLRVLAAEDNSVNQILLHELLSPYVKQLEIVDDGESAIEAASKQVYDVILMDVRLPGIDGVAATKAIRRLGAAWKTRPIIALTANAMSEQHSAYIEAGMTSCLSKPIDCTKLYATLSAIAAESLPQAGPEIIGTGDRHPPVSKQAAPPPAAAAPEHPMIDKNGLEQLVAIIGPQSVAGLLEQLIAQLRESVQQLDDAATEPSALSAIAHTLAGAAGNCQAVRVSKLARELEHAIGDSDDVTAPMQALRRAVDDTLIALVSEIERLQDEPAIAPRRFAAL